MKTIELTRDHIVKGSRCNPYECPIALALRDAGFRDPCVTDKKWSPHKEAGGQMPRNYFPLPEPARKFVRDFDNREFVTPFSFTLEVPE